MKHKKIYIEQY